MDIGSSYKILSKKDRGAFRVLQAKFLICKWQFIIIPPRVLEKITEEIMPPVLPPMSKIFVTFKPSPKHTKDSSMLLPKLKKIKYLTISI